jgi:hypothetical protein
LEFHDLELGSLQIQKVGGLHTEWDKPMPVYVVSFNKEERASQEKGGHVTTGRDESSSSIIQGRTTIINHH